MMDASVSEATLLAVLSWDFEDSNRVDLNDNGDAFGGIVHVSSSEEAGVAGPQS